MKGHVIDSEVPHVEAGLNASTVALRVVGGDEKGSLESETEKKYGHESHGTWTRKYLYWRVLGTGTVVPVLN
jgi:hypothetical protein